MSRRSEAEGDARIGAILERSAEFAAVRGVEIFAVGGYVRDRLLGLPAADLDLVWVGDGDPALIAGDFADHFSASVEYRAAFLTASCEVEGVRVDLGRARVETYSEPAALPSVRPGSLREDLLRRDFSVNTLAWPARLARSPASDPSEVIDLCGGRADLESRTLRTLHGGSFDDDPTRILRGIELAIRRGLEFSVATECEARAAVSSGRVSLLSGARLRHELERLLRDWSRVPAGVARLRSLGLDRAIDPGFRIDDAALDRVSLFARTPVDSGTETGEAESWLVALALLAWDGSTEDRESLARRLALSRRQKGFMTSAVLRVRAAIDSLTAIDYVSMEAVRHCGGLTAGEFDLVERLIGRLAGSRLENLGARLAIELGIGGADLRVRGVPAGPAIGVALKRTLAARRTGEIDASQELAFALALLSRDGGDSNG